MKTVTWEDTETIQVLINEFIVTHKIDSKESIPIEFLRYLRSIETKIEEGSLLNEICDTIEAKLNLK